MQNAPVHLHQPAHGWGPPAFEGWVKAKVGIGFDQPTVEFLRGFIEIRHDYPNSHLSFLGFVRHVVFEHALYAVIWHRKQEAELPPKLMRKAVCPLTRLNIGRVRR